MTSFAKPKINKVFSNQKKIIILHRLNKKT